MNTNETSSPSVEAACSEWCKVCQRPFTPYPDDDLKRKCECLQIHTYAMSNYPGEHMLVWTHPENEGPQYYRREDVEPIVTELLDALRTLNAHYDDLRKSNPGFMGKMCLQDYQLWNIALLKSEKTLARFSHIPNSTD